MKALRKIIRALRKLVPAAKEKKSLYRRFADAGCTTNSYVYGDSRFPHYITEIDNANGVPTVRNLYDDSGRLIGMIDAAGRTNRFVVDLNARTETVYDRSGNPTIHTFDSRGNITNVVDALGRRTARTFDDNNHVTSVTDTLTNTYRFTYDGWGNRTSIVDPLNHANFTIYDSHGLLLTNIDALGRVTSFQYDDRGNPTNTVDALTNHYATLYNQIGKLAAIVDPLNRTNMSAGYDSVGNLQTLSNSISGVVRTFDYDANGNQTGSSNRWVNPGNPADVRVITNRTVFDALGRETLSIDSNGKQSGVAYNGVGSPTQVTDPYQRTIAYLYDSRGNPVQITHADSTFTRMVYDEQNRLSVSDDSHLDGAVANGTRLTCDVVGRVVKSERLTNVVITLSTFNGCSSSELVSYGGVIGVTSYGYDDGDRQTAVTNAFGAVTRYEYDALGRRTAVIDALTNRTDYVYDAAGRLIFETNALHRVTEHRYDALGRPVRTIYPDGTSAAVAYNELGQRTSETNRLGLVTDFEYYPANSLLKAIVKPPVFDPETNGVVRPRFEFEYDSYARLKLVRDPKKRETQFTSDQLGRPWTHTLPMNQTASQWYDDFGRLSRQVDFKGQTNELIYDSAGRLRTNRCYALGSATPSEIVTYSYDDQDRTKQIIQPHGTNSFDYDSQGGVTRITSPEGIVNYEYEPVEGRRVRTYTSSSDLRYAYDELGRLKTVTVVKRDGSTLAVPEVTTNLYTALGSLEHVYYPNGVQSLYQYDVMNRLTNLVYTSGSQLLAQYKYSCASNGQWKAATEIQWQSGSSYSTNQIGWNYDNLGRLTNEVCSSTVAGLNYTNSSVFDLAGNRLWLTNRAGSTETISYTYNANDQLLKEASSLNGTFTNWFDANGSLTNRGSTFETNAYTFNLRNKLSSATFRRSDSGHTINETVSFTYDSRGNRVRAQWSRSIDGGAAVSGTNIFLNEPNNPSGFNQVLEELPATGAAPTASYTLGGRVVSQGRSGTISHLLPDGHGSTRELADSSAGITARFTYDACGKPLDFTANAYTAPATPILYSAGRLDTDLLQYGLGARYYNPTVSRFNQIDPFSGNQQSGANLYSYASDDPVNSSDPSGLYDIDVHRYLSEFLAEKANFDHDDSVAIGQAALQPDLKGRAAGFGLIYGENNANWHFVTRSRVRELAGSIHGVNDQDFFTAVGDFLHAQEDSYGHCSGELDRDWDNYGGETDGLFGHGFQGHYPDFTFWRPAKAMRMAERVYADLKHINLTGGHYDDVPDLATENGAPALDAATAQTVKIFLEYPEKPGDAAGSGAYVTETIGGFNLTRQSMLNKIRLLFPGLPDPTASGDPSSDEARVLRKFDDVSGHRFGTYRSFNTPRGGEIMMGASPFGY